MTQQSRALDVEVTRPKSEILDELMGYRDQKVESDTQFPASYKANIYGSGNPAEDAFYEAFADSSISMTVTPGTNFETMQSLAKSVLSVKDAEVDLGAKIDGIRDHAPVIQTGMEALEDAGFEPYAELWKEKCYGGSVSEAIDNIEEEGMGLEVWSSDPINNHPDAHYVVATYNPENQTLSPDSSVCSVNHGSEGGVEEINRRMEEALDEVGLLE